MQRSAGQPKRRGDRDVQLRSSNDRSSGKSAGCRRKKERHGTVVKSTKDCSGLFWMSSEPERCAHATLARSSPALRCTHAALI
eukprot:983705-Pleurochrysis_carterae.AAC.1